MRAHVNIGRQSERKKKREKKEEKTEKGKGGMCFCTDNFTITAFTVAITDRTTEEW